MEINRPGMRHCVAAFSCRSVPAGGILVALLGLFVYQKWHSAFLNVAIFSLLALPVGLLLFESPRWLIVHRNFSKARRILNHGINANGGQPPADMDEKLRTAYESHRIQHLHVHNQIPLPSALSTEDEYWSMKRQNYQKAVAKWRQFLVPVVERKFRLKTCVLLLQWFVVGLVFYGTYFMALGGQFRNINPFVMLLAICAGQIIWALCFASFVNCFGKASEVYLAISYTASGVALGLLTWILIKGEKISASWQTMVLIVIAIASIDASLEMLYSFT